MVAAAVLRFLRRPADSCKIVASIQQTCSEQTSLQRLVRSFAPSRNHQVSTMTLVSGASSDIKFHVLSRVIYLNSFVHLIQMVVVKKVQSDKTK